MIKCRFLPLNLDSFFDFKLKSCGSVIQDNKTLIRTKSATLWRIMLMSQNVRGPISFLLHTLNSTLYTVLFITEDH